jgi:hypothetical protein
MEDDARPQQHHELLRVRAGQGKPMPDERFSAGRRASGID